MKRSDFNKYISNLYVNSRENANLVQVRVFLMKTETTEHDDHVLSFKDQETNINFVADWKRFGAGRMEYRNGDLYTGTWDGAHGKGIIVYTDGSSYEVSG